MQHIDLAVEGRQLRRMHVQDSSAGFSAIPDVTLARVNLTDRRVALEWKQGALDPARFIDRLAGSRIQGLSRLRPPAAEAAEARTIALPAALPLGVAALRHQ